MAIYSNYFIIITLYLFMDLFHFKGYRAAIANGENCFDVNLIYKYMEIV